MKREYQDIGLLSKDSALYVYDDALSKYVLLIPTTDMPETKGAPATVEKTVLTEHSVTEVEGLQTNDQKTYTFNYHRDNINRVKKFIGRTLRLLEVNSDLTGEAYTGSIKLARNSIEVNGIVQGSLYVTVSSAEDLPIDDVRDLIANTAVLTTPLNDIVTTAQGEVSINLEANPETATFTAVATDTDICTVAVEGTKLTVTGVAVGYSKVVITTSADGEASSERSFLVEVTATEN